MKANKTVTSLLIILLLLIQICFIPVMTVNAEGSTLPSGVADEKIGETLDAFLDEHEDNHAAVAVSVFRGEDDIYSRCFGFIDADGTVPLDEECVLEWGSTSKLLIWVSAMQLYEQGKLDLSADIKNYLPEGFLKNLKFDKTITMLNLMNHNAGFQETDFQLEALDEEDIVPFGEYLAKNQPLQVFEPGTVSAYSNWGAALAGYIVECISGMPYYEYVQKNIFAPLEMTHSALNSDLSDNSYVRERRNDFVTYTPDGELWDEPTKVYILPYPAGMCVSTPGDFVTFAKALLNKDERLLKAETFDELYSPSLLYTDTDKARLDHGFLVDYDFAVTVVGHDGNTAGGSSRIILDLENGIGMTVITNQLGGSLYRTKMAELVFGTADYHIDVDGYYVPARSVFHGRKKFFSNFTLINHCHFTKEMTDGMYFNVASDHLEFSSTDYITPPVNYRLQDALTIAWFVLVGLALVSFLVRIIIAIVLRIKKKEQSKLNLICAVFGLLIFLSLSALIGLPETVMLIYTIILCACAVAFAVYLIKRRKDNRQTKLQKVSYYLGWALIPCMIMTVVNLIMWEFV